MVDLASYGETDVGEFDAEADALCLSFTNTADWHASEQPLELLRSYADLISWGVLRGVLTGEEARQLLQTAKRQPEQASQVLERAVELRETIYRLFSAAAAKRPVARQDIDQLNEALPEALAQRRIDQAKKGLTWGWSKEAATLDQVLWPVIHSTAELLTSPEFKHVGQCHDDRGCGWLFLDMSRNHSRRWCSMERCGNRAKAQRHYKRSKDEQRRRKE